jgi:hypothetical protein
MIAPFLTNDGVCLLFVEIILNAFEMESSSVGEDGGLSMIPSQKKPSPPVSPLPADDGALLDTKAGESTIGSVLNREEDAAYFLLTLACSSNIGRVH